MDLNRFYGKVFAKGQHLFLIRNSQKSREKWSQGSSLTQFKLLSKISFRHSPSKIREEIGHHHHQATESLRPVRKQVILGGVEGKGQTKVACFLHTISPEKWNRIKELVKLRRDSASLPVSKSVHKNQLFPSIPQ